ATAIPAPVWSRWRRVMLPVSLRFMFGLPDGETLWHRTGIGDRKKRTTEARRTQREDAQRRRVGFFSSGLTCNWLQPRRGGPRLALAPRLIIPRPSGSGPGLQWHRPERG